MSWDNALDARMEAEFEARQRLADEYAEYRAVQVASMLAVTHSGDVSDALANLTDEQERAIAVGMQTGNRELIAGVIVERLTEYMEMLCDMQYEATFSAGDWYGRGQPDRREDAE